MAAMLVVLFHIPGWHPMIHDIPFIRNGYLMVDLFFVLSGFVIYRAYSDGIGSFSHLGKFQFLRAGRLFPVHLVMLGVFVLIECAKYLAHRHGIASTNSTPFGQNGPVAFVEQLFLLQGLGPTGNKSSFNGAAWSISTEFYTYFVFGMIVLTARKFKDGVFALVALSSIALLVVVKGSGFEDLLRCQAGFFVGCLTAWAAGQFHGRLHPIVVTLTAGAMLLFFVRKRDPALDPFILPITAALVFTLVASGTSVLKRFLYHRWLVGLGTISYSVYMCHEAIIWFANQIFRVGLKRPEHAVDGQTVPMTSAIEAFIAAAIVVLAVVCVSVLLYRFVEKRAREQSRKMVLFPSLVEA